MRQDSSLSLTPVQTAATSFQSTSQHTHHLFGLLGVKREDEVIERSNREQAGVKESTLQPFKAFI